MKFRGKKQALTGLMLMQMFPSVLALVAIYAIFDRIGNAFPAFGIDTHWALLLAYSGGIALHIWTIKGYYDTIPYEIEEAAKVDGAPTVPSRWLLRLEALVFDDGLIVPGEDEELVRRHRREVGLEAAGPSDERRGLGGLRALRAREAAASASVDQGNGGGHATSGAAGRLGTLFTASFGVADSTMGSGFDQLVRIADDVVVNDGDTASLAGRVDELHNMYLQLAAAKA